MATHVLLVGHRAPSGRFYDERLEAPAGTVTHTYTAPGDYTVRFSATDNDGAVGAATLVINVPAAPGAGLGAPAPAAPIGGGG